VARKLAHFEVVNTASNSFTALSLDKYAGGRIKIVVANGKVVNISQEGSARLAIKADLEYGHVELSIADNGIVQVQPLPYRPTPYTQLKANFDMWVHPDGKYWSCNASLEDRTVIYANAQTYHRVVHQKLKSFSDAQREQVIRRKEADGYVKRSNASLNDSGQIHIP